VALFRRLAHLFRSIGTETHQADALIFYLRCDRCGEVVPIRVNRRWDLLQELDDGVTGYSLHKDVLGAQCNALMRMLVLFDNTYTITRQEAEGGRFVSQAEYDAYRAGRGAPGD